MLGEKIRTLRKQRGWTIADLAEKVGLSAGMISHIERGEKEGSLDTISRIASAFSISPGLLMDPTLDLDRLSDVSEILEACGRLSEAQLDFVLKMVTSLPPQQNA